MDLSQIILDSVLYFEIGCAIIGTIYLSKVLRSKTLLYLIYLYILCIIEVIGRYTIGYDNRWLYNVLGILEFGTFSFIFWKDQELKNSKKTIALLAALGGSAILAEALFFSDPPFKSYLSYSFSITSLFLSIMCLLYFWTLVKSDKIVHFSKILLFWLAMGLLVFHMCVLPITVVMNRIPDISSSNTLLVIQAILSIIMYCCFSIGFIWSSKKYNT